MAMASLSLKISNNNTENSFVTLETGTLRYIDSIIKSFANEEALKTDEEFQEKMSHLSPMEINNSKVVLTYIKNNNDKIVLKPIFNDPHPIRTRAKAVEEVKSEVEKARKLMFSSKNQLFLSLFLNNQSLVRTTYSTIKISKEENRQVKLAGLTTFIKDGDHQTTIKDILKYRRGAKKLGSMRLLVEDSLELWKKNMLNLPEEDLYFYSRELRVLINEYDYRKIPRRAVYNLILNRAKLKTLDVYTINRREDIYNTNIKYKQKILDEAKI